MDYQLIEGRKFDLLMKFYEPGALGFDRFASRCAGKPDDGRTVPFPRGGRLLVAVGLGCVSHSQQGCNSGFLLSS
jgi:hypothetical protein